MIRRAIVTLLAIGCTAFVGCARESASRPTRSHESLNLSAAPPAQTSEHSEKTAASEAALFAELDKAFGRKGEVAHGVYRLVTPRPDLFVTVNGMDVPTGAFLESDFRFWHCPCGKPLVNGQFVVADFEANDVIDELQLGHLEIASLGPLLMNERPRLMLIRFQGEGEAKQLATALKSALSYTGEARTKPAPANLSPPAE